jgi:hypothetical protein
VLDMTTARYFAKPAPQDIIAWTWHVVDRQSGRPVEHAQGLSEERARRIADLMSRAEHAGPTPEFDGLFGWMPDDRGRTIAHVECDRLRERAAPGIAGPIKINGRSYECVDVLAGTLPGRPIRPGEPIGLVLSKPYP